MKRNQILIAKICITQGKLGLKMVQMKSHTKQRPTDKENKLMVLKGEDRNIDAALSQHHLSGFEIAKLEFHHLR